MAVDTSKLQVKKPSRFALNLWQREVLTFYGFISPWIFGFIGLTIIPMVFAIYISFTNFNGFDLAGASFIGPGNYVEAIKNPISWKSLGLTVYLTDENQTLAVQLMLHTRTPGVKYYAPIPPIPYQATVGILYTVPLIALFFFAQRYFIKGIATTGLKG